MTSLKNKITSHPRLGFGLLAGALVVLFLVLVPLPYQRTNGYNLQLAGINDGFPETEFARALDALGYPNLSLRVIAEGGETRLTIPNIQSLQIVKEIAAACKSLAGTEVTVKITPNIETVSASLYAQARERMVKIEVDGTDKTDEQIKAEIEAKLAAQGCDKPLVYFKREPGGKKTIQMELKTNDCSNINPSQQTLEIDARGKTDDQIKAEIQSKLAAEGHQNAQVSITTSGSDSTLERKIEIQIQDTTGN